MSAMLTAVRGGGGGGRGSEGEEERVEEEKEKEKEEEEEEEEDSGGERHGCRPAFALPVCVVPSLIDVSCELGA